MCYLLQFDLCSRSRLEFDQEAHARNANKSEHEAANLNRKIRNVAS
jgi:hypothetical protein